MFPKTFDEHQPSPTLLAGLWPIGCNYILQLSSMKHPYPGIQDNLHIKQTSSMTFEKMGSTSPKDSHGWHQQLSYDPRGREGQHIHRPLECRAGEASLLAAESLVVPGWNCLPNMTKSREMEHIRFHCIMNLKIIYHHMISYIISCP